MILHGCCCCCYADCRLQLTTFAGVKFAAFEQRWTSESPVEAIAAFQPDVLLLDHFMPPYNGLHVLRLLNEAVKAGVVQRPRFVLGVSSVQSCNDAMIGLGADAGFVKWDAHRWSGWAKTAR